MVRDGAVVTLGDSLSTHTGERLSLGLAVGMLSTGISATAHTFAVNFVHARPHVMSILISAVRIPLHPLFPIPKLFESSVNVELSWRTTAPPFESPLAMLSTKHELITERSPRCIIPIAPADPLFLRNMVF